MCVCVLALQVFEEAKYLEGEEQLDAQLIGLPLPFVAFAWMYTIVWFLVQDFCKVMMYKLLYYFDVCGIRTEAEANEERVRKNKALQAEYGDSGPATPAVAMGY